MVVVFLDIDGVLNSEQYMRSKKGTVYAEGFQYPGLEWWADGLDPEAMERLNRLVEQTGAEIVVSSTWRLGGDVGWLQQLLEIKGFRGQVVGVTPHYGDGPRSREITAWVNRFGPERYVVLDDDSDAEIPGKTVRTSSRCGLTDEDVDKAVGILGEKGRPRDAVDPGRG